MNSFLMLGFMLGIRHALEADHVATVAALASHNPSRKRVLRQGLVWGMGHSITILLIAGTVMWMDSLIPAHIATSLETLVGISMLLLGGDVLRRTIKSAREYKRAKAAHTYNNTIITRSAQADSSLRALLMGLLHGMAGSAALLLVFVGEMQSILQGFGYLLLFSIGSIGGMLLFSLVISVPLIWSTEKMPSLHTGLQFTIGTVTLGIGGIITASGII